MNDIFTEIDKLQEEINPAPSNGVLDPARRINAPSHPRSKLRGFRGRGGINKYRPLDKNLLKQIKEYYRIGLTYTSNALEKPREII